MHSSFKNFIQKEALCNSGDNILLAVSGGVDSVVMCELFHKAGIPFGIAHCNFKLRDKESEDDELFVKELAKKYKVHFHTTSFDTSSFAKKNKLSIQAAARELRYNWFKQICSKNHYSMIASAHHSDDSVETFMINLIRGTGIAGLHGILPKQGNIIRPLLFSNKEEITAFAKKQKLKYREDSSNTSDKYLRNKIRKKMIPLLKELNPKIDSVLLDDIQRLREVERIFRKEIDNKKSEILRVKNSAVLININQLKKLDPLPTYLFEFLKPFNFNAATVRDIITSLDGIPGKQFFSSTHRLLKDRLDLIIEKIDEQDDSTVTVKKEQKKILAGNLKISIKKLPAGTKFSHSQMSAALDLDKLTFPLTIRRWEQGDSFRPFGMKGKKKLSDFFIDRKLSLREKENTLLLVSGKDIVWVIGQRIDDRYRVTENTRKIYFAELTE
jgi:tRNA(Ile)-lysidine synthase